MKNNELNNSKWKLLTLLQNQLAYTIDDQVIRYQMFHSNIHKNLTNALVNVNNFIFKLKQFEVKEEIEVGRHIN